MKKVIFLILFLYSAILLPQQQFNSKPKNFIIDSRFIIEQNITDYFLQPKNIYSNIGIFSVYPDFRILPTSVNQSTISSAINLANPNIIFAGANTDLGQGYYISTNAGFTWVGSDFLPGSIAISTNPAVLIAQNGNLLFNYFDNTLVIDRSGNNGQSWIGRTVIPTSGGFDKNFAAIDQLTTSPYYQRLYISYTRWSPPYPIVAVYSTNLGQSFSNEIQIGSPQLNHYEQGVNLQTGPGGIVYAVWATPNISNAYIEDKIGFSKSTNGGVTWSTPTLPITINGIRGSVLNSNIRVNSFPSMGVDRSGGARNGYIYFCWAQKNLSPAGSDADIIFAFSSNGGTSFSTPVRVNDDALNNGKPQFLPWLTVDQANGNISIVYYDTRDVATLDSCNTYMAFSPDGGTNWTNFKVSSSPQKPVPIQGYATGYYTDYISVSAHNGNIYPFWTDNRSGKAQIYSAKVTLGPVIVHDSLKDTENLTGPYTVNTKLLTMGSNINPSLTKIVWGRNGLTDSIALTNSSGNNWTGNIPGNGSSSEYRYYIKAVDLLGRTGLLPANAPTGYLSFNVGPDVIKPVILHTPLPDTPKPAWPLRIKAIVTDNIGVDSVWVKWYINNTSQGIRHLRLIDTGYTYSGKFISNLNEVNVNDSIFYRIFARDVSSNHNVDSTILYKFKLTNIATIFVGNGTLLSSYPFTTFYTDARTEFIYNASDIVLAGGAEGTINRIGFEIATASPVQLNGLTIKIQNTTASTLTGFTFQGWTIAYTGNYVVSGTGWRYIDLSIPHYWNEGYNLFIEVCFDNGTFGQNSNVYSSNAPGTVWHQHQDLWGGNGCINLIDGSVQNARPNISLTINYVVGIKELSNEIPESFVLHQNYPNPFNSSTKIKFDIPKAGLIKLVVYDLLGRQISTLVNEKLNPGIYESIFNAENLSSGIYFYRLESEIYSVTKKLILLK
jgi:hypothetical protein